MNTKKVFMDPFNSDNTFNLSNTYSNTPFEIRTNESLYTEQKPKPISIITNEDADLFPDEDEEYFNTPTTSTIPIPSYPNDPVKGRKMMQMMGYEEGQGLGSKGQGRTQPITVTQKQGRSGLGMTEERSLPPAFKVQRHDPDTTNYPVEQTVEYVSCKSPISNTANVYKTTISNNKDDNPLSPYLLKKLYDDIMKAKSEFDDLDSKIFIDARSRANPYERIGKSIFQNRAAIKMANIDKVCKISEIPKLPEEKNTLYFADICAGPGGFTEFIYYKHRDCAKGWGFTLKGKDDFRLDKFNKDSPADNFELCYGADDTGDITKNDNIKYLSNVIDKGTDGRGVALVMGDGGFSVQGNENEQEFLMKQLILCQCITAFEVLRKGGNFMCKVYDVYSTFSVSLLFILYQNFEQFAIFKPLASRPANSERYFKIFDSYIIDISFVKD